MQRKLHIVLNSLVIVAVVLGLTGALSAINPGYGNFANQTVAQTNPGAGARAADTTTAARNGDVAVLAKKAAAAKPIDQPNPLDKARMMERQRMLEAGQTAEAASLAQTGADRVLVILVEFAGTDVFTWTAPITPTDYTTGSQWDPLGIANANEAVLDENGDPVLGDCSNIITQTKTFTYTGPLHNTIERPRSAADESGDSIWTPDFSPQWFTDFMFGNGVVISYTRQDASPVYESFTGQSVKQYFGDLSSGAYTVTGDVIGWVGVPHSTWYYDADQCPGSRSGASTSQGVIPGAGNARTLVIDTLKQVNAISNTISGFDWANYDQNGDGIIDRLWIVHAGYGEEDATTLLNRMPVSGATPLTDTFYGESAVWSHSSSVTPAYSVTQNIAAGAYIVMPENGGIGVFAHEYAHNLGADDLYAYGEGETSTGFWALQADDWTGYPIGFEPPAPDPWHLDNWGWLSPKVITDASQVYTVTLGQASYFNTNTATGPVYRGVKIPLPPGAAPLPVPVWQGSNYWWGGKQDVANATMTSKPITIPAGMSNLTFDLAYDIESQWDFLWIGVSADGTNWMPLTNTNTSCVHDSSWIGGLYGFPDDLCAAGLGGFTGSNANWPDPQTQVFTIISPITISGYLRFWYMTDWGTTFSGPFVDNITVKSGGNTLFADDAESGDAKWTYAAPWVRSTGSQSFTHNYYLQWRNTHANGGYDSALGDPRWRFGPANTGLLMWYNNNFYTDNEVFNYLTDFPGYGPKGRMLVVDSHPDPYREPALVAAGYNNEAGNVTDRSQMRDAPFTLQDTVDFTYTSAYPFPITTTLFTNHFDGRPAVNTFNDAFGYYPGAEFVPGGPVGQTSPRWMTKQWDASSVVPSKEFYGIKAPGYTDGNRFRYDCSFGGTGNAQALCYSYATGLGYDGGAGNPGDVGGQYGWHVQLIEEATDHTWAKVRIWNGAVVQTPAYTPASITLPGAKTFTYTYELENQSPVTSTVAVTFTLDSHLTSASQLVYLALALSAGQQITLTVVATGTVPNSMSSGAWTTIVTMKDSINQTVWTNPLPTTISFHNIFLPLIRR